MRNLHLFLTFALIIGCARGQVEVSIADPHATPITSVAISPDGALIATASTDDDIQLWALSPRAKIAEFPGNWSVDFSSDGQFVVAGSGAYDPPVIWDVARGQRRATLPHAQGYASLCAIFLPGSHHAAWGDFEGFVSVWDLDSAKMTMRHRVVDKRSEGITAMAASRSGKLLAVGTSSGCVAILDSKTGKPVQSLWKAHDRDRGDIRELAFANDDELLASAGSDTAIRFWAIRTGKLVRRFETGDVLQAFALSRDETMLATGSGVAVSCWKWGPSPELITRRRTRCSDSLAFSNDGTVLVAGGRERGTSSEVLILRIKDPEKGRSPIK